MEHDTKINGHSCIKIYGGLIIGLLIADGGLGLGLVDPQIANVDPMKTYCLLAIFLGMPMAMLCLINIAVHHQILRWQIEAFARKAQQFPMNLLRGGFGIWANLIHGKKL